jgi:hypothetical protein
MDIVPPKNRPTEHLVGAVPRKGTQRLLLRVRTTEPLISCCDDSPNAELGAFEDQSIQDDAVPSIFGVGLASLHHDVWAEPVHLNRLCESRVEIIK